MNTKKEATPRLKSEDVPYNAESPINYFELYESLHGASDVTAPAEFIADFNQKTSKLMHSIKQELQDKEKRFCEWNTLNGCVPPGALLSREDDYNNQKAHKSKLLKELAVATERLEVLAFEILLSETVSGLPLFETALTNIGVLWIVDRDSSYYSGASLVKFILETLKTQTNAIAYLLSLENGRELLPEVANREARA